MSVSMRVCVFSVRVVWKKKNKFEIKGEGGAYQTNQIKFTQTITKLEMKQKKNHWNRMNEFEKSERATEREKERMNE